MSTIDQLPGRPTILIIMDGIGHNPSKLNNGVALARTPNLDRIYASTPTTVIEASGRAVGLPAGQMGNSEVGHITIGSGQILNQDLVRINDAIDSDELSKNPALISCLAQCSQGAKLHLLGLVSDGGVHSHIDHLLALLKICGDHQVEPVLHLISDGRDTAPANLEVYLQQLERALAACNGRIATISGRFYAMDRDQRWERIELSYRAIASGQGPHFASASAALNAAREMGKTDEFIVPCCIGEPCEFKKGDQVLFFNFRNDRPRQLSQALALRSFDAFPRDEFVEIELTTMTHYGRNTPSKVIFDKEAIERTLGAIVSEAGYAQFHAAETEKYPHVTFFFNGGVEAALTGESRSLSPSPKVKTYDLDPKMSARSVCDHTIAAVESAQYAFIVVNFANGDMVGHTGVAAAVIEAVEVVDQVVGELWDAAVAAGYSIILTADHGNADMLVDPLSGAPHTQHTTFPVACAIHHQPPVSLLNGGGLSNIAATTLALMGLAIDPVMEGSLIAKN